MATRLGSRWHRLRAGASALALLGLSGCLTIGESGRQDELARSRGRGDFAVVSQRPDRVVFAARGQRIVVRPPEGYCLDRDALETNKGSAFALVSDCLEDRRAELAQEDSSEGEVVAIDLPRSFPGIMTVSISGEPGFGPSGASLDEFEKLLKSAPGRALLSRGSDGATGRIVAMRRVGGAVYVLVEEDAIAPGFLSPRFWRGFIDVNDRLVLVTVSSFSDRPIDEDGMMAFLASQVSQLRRGNGLPAVGEEDRIAGQIAMVFAEAPGAPLEIVRAEPEAETRAEVGAGGATKAAPQRAPLPPRSPRAPRTPRPQIAAPQVQPAPQPLPLPQAARAPATGVPLPPPRPFRHLAAPAAASATTPAAVLAPAAARTPEPGLATARDAAPVRAPKPPRRPR